MTTGITTAIANGWLNTLKGTAYTAVQAGFVQLHTADPGAAGTTAVSSVTTRPAATWTTSTVASLVMSGTLPSWAAWAGTNGEVVTHISFWTASSAGTFVGSCALALPKTVNTGDTLSLSSASAALTPIAA